MEPMYYALVALAVVMLSSLAAWYVGRKWSRLVMLECNTFYLRFYPNPGVGVRLGNRRAALSVAGGLEFFQGRSVPPPELSGNLTGGDRIWVRTYAKFSRVKRLGGRV